MTQYYSPKCNDTDKLVKSRCQCKKSTKKTVKIRVIKKPKSNLKITVKKRKPKVVKKAKRVTKKKKSFLEKHRGPLYFKTKFVEEINQKWKDGLSINWTSRYGPHKGRCKKGYIKNPDDKFCYTFSDAMLKKHTQNTKPKTIKKIKNNKYQEQWALEPGKYALRVPNEKQLKIRRNRIDKVYELHEKIKKMDKKVLHPKKWQYPPEFLLNKMLQSTIVDLKADLKYLKKEAKEKVKTAKVKKTTPKKRTTLKKSLRKKSSPSSKAKTKRKRCPNGTKKDPLSGNCVPKTGVSKKKTSISKKQGTVIDNNTPKLAKELKKAQKKGNIKFSPSINRQLMTLKSVTPRGNIYDCPDGGVLVTTAKGSKCYSWKTKKAKEVMLKNLNTTKPVSAKLIIAPAQHQSNCWMNSFFVSWFLSDSGRKFNRWFRQTCITGILPDSKKSIPNKLKKPAFLLNKMIDASLRSKTEGDPARYAELMDTNDIIRQFHRAIPRGRIVKTKKASNPLTFYSTIYRKMLGIGDSHIGWQKGDISYTKGPMSWLNFYLSSDSPPTVKELNKLVGNASIIGDFIPKVIFLEVQDSPSILFNTSKKLEFTVDRQYVLNRKNVKPGKKYSYTLDAAVLRDTKKVHFSAYITINGVDYGFDGESYSRLEKFNWKSKLNKNTQWRFAEQYETYFNFNKGYQLLIYYRDS